MEEAQSERKLTKKEQAKLRNLEKMKERHEKQKEKNAGLKHPLFEQARSLTTLMFQQPTQGAESDSEADEVSTYLSQMAEYNLEKINKPIEHDEGDLDGMEQDSPTLQFRGTPTSDTPTSGIPTSGIPTSGIPTSGIPTSGIPTSGIPTSGIPTSGIPTSGIPTSGIPTSDTPTSGTPTSDIPTSDTPTSDIPTSDTPTSGIPTSDTPTSGTPTSDTPTSDTPTSGIPTSGIPTSGIPTSGIPTSDTPTSGIPTSGTPTSGIPTSGIPTSGIPTSGIPTSGIPTSGTPTSGIPTSGIPTSGIPTSGIPTSGIPTSVIDQQLFKNIDEIEYRDVERNLYSTLSLKQNSLIKIYLYIFRKFRKDIGSEIFIHDKVLRRVLKTTSADVVARAKKVGVEVGIWDVRVVRLKTANEEQGTYYKLRFDWMK